MVAIRRSLHHYSFLLPGAQATPPLARLVMSKRPESFIPWPLAHLPRPVAFAPRQSSSLSRAPPVGRAAYSSEHAFAQTVQPNTGLHLAHEGRTGMDQIAGDCFATSSRGGSKNGNRIGALLVEAARETSTSLPLGWRPAHRLTNGTMAAARIRAQFPTMTHTIRQVYAHPVSDFSQAISRLRGQLLVRQGAQPAASAIFS